MKLGGGFAQRCSSRRCGRAPRCLPSSSFSSTTAPTGSLFLERRPTKLLTASVKVSSAGVLASRRCVAADVWRRGDASRPAFGVEAMRYGRRLASRRCVAAGVWRRGDALRPAFGVEAMLHGRSFRTRCANIRRSEVPSSALASHPRRTDHRTRTESEENPHARLDRNLRLPVSSLRPFGFTCLFPETEACLGYGIAELTRCFALTVPDVTGLVPRLR
jgi:hypothetical protein